MARSRSVTIEDVARTAGVSRAAVSKVIRNASGVSAQMRAKVQAAIDELDYRPLASARAMRGSSFTIGVEIPSIHNNFFLKIIAGASGALADSPYTLIIAPAAPDHDLGPQAIQVLADRQVDGIVAISSRVSPEWLEDLGHRVPLVMLGRHLDAVHYDTLVGDDQLGAEVAVRHLYDLGHRRIVHITLDESDEETRRGNPHNERVVGYLRTMSELGLSAEVVKVDPNLGAGQVAGREAARALLTALSGPVGIFAAHDELALGVLEVVGELGLSPGEASVVGYDDAPISAHPMISLTSVNQSGTHMGETAMRLLRERIDGRQHSMREVVTPRLIARSSSAPPAMRQVANR